MSHSVGYCCAVCACVNKLNDLTTHYSREQAVIVLARCVNERSFKFG